MKRLLEKSDIEDDGIIDKNPFTEREWEDKNSRLLATLEKRTLRLFQRASALIIGLNGLGIEIAKNLVLMGINRLVIRDNNQVQISDLSSNFYLTEGDVGMNRATVCLDKLSSLNFGVTVSVWNDELTLEKLKEFDVVILTNTKSKEEVIQINDFCRKASSENHTTSTIICDSLGLFGYCFLDFGQNFVVVDNGLEPTKGFLAGISNEEKGIVTVLDQRHGLSDGDTVILSEVEGMKEVNDREFKIEVVGPFQFKIDCDTRNYGIFTTRGYFKQIIKPIVKQFTPISQFYDFKENLNLFTNVVPTDESKIFTRAGLYWLFIQALQIFYKSNSRLPKPHSQDEAQQVLDIAIKINEEIQNKEHKLSVEELNKDVFLQLVKTCSGDLSPMATTLGGIVAQQALTAVTGKFNPIYQWFFVEHLECLPDNINPDDCQLTNTRYDGQVAVFGKTFNEKLINLKYFIVGSGAIGCELLKTFAMIGIGGGPNGELFLTDMDTIEFSNLNRQFLFRKTHIGSQKSKVASEAVKKMNPNLKITPFSIKVYPETENIFGDDFWTKLDGVANALDNLDARLYIDRRCVFYKKPLIDAGTEGTKGNVQVVIPDVTQSYGASQDATDNVTIPVCTLHHFPSKIEHCLAWSRDVLFEELFVIDPDYAVKYFKNPSFFEDLNPNSRMAALDSLERTILNYPKNFDQCIEWAFRLYEKWFVNAPQQILYNYPLEHEEDGVPFWSGSHRPPKPIEFDINNELCVDFVVSAAYLRAYTMGLINVELKSKQENYSKELESIKAQLSQIKHIPFKPKTDSKIPNPKKNEKITLDLSDEKSKQIIESLTKVPKEFTFVKTVQFEKDNDDNFHIDFIHAASNLRANNYSIPTIPRLNSKLIAGRIIPAIVTTTAVVAGLQCFELYKSLWIKNLEKYRNAFINLAVPIFQLSEPMPPIKKIFNKKPFTEWDRINIKPGKGDIPLKKLLGFLQTKLHIVVNTLIIYSASIYMDIVPNHKQRLNKGVAQLVEEITKKEIPMHVKHFVLTVNAQDKEGKEIIDLPTLVYWFK